MVVVVLGVGVVQVVMGVRLVQKELGGMMHIRSQTLVVVIITMVDTINGWTTMVRHTAPHSTPHLLLLEVRGVADPPGWTRNTVDTVVLVLRLLVRKLDNNHL
tara:strand:- start:120 stop:428 length:309 start_codon:yes stop_codon:yes gene_type:complete